VFFDKQAVDSLAEKLRDFNYKLYNRQTILDNARNFSDVKFADNIQKIVKELTNARR
jgi:hypothetical protein